MGLEAFDAAGVSLGRIDMVHDYGAGTSLEIGRLIVPFTKACVPVVDIEGGRVTVVVPDEIVVAPQPEDRAVSA
jgi:16S rRNA processing protein RimM